MNRLVLAALAIAVSGCLEAADGAVLDAEAVADLARATPGGRAHRWTGTVTAPPAESSPTFEEFQCYSFGVECRTTPAPCTEDTCSRVAVDVRVPRDFWATHEGALVLTVRFPTSPDYLVDAWIEDADGAVVAYAPHDFFYATSQVARLESPAPGRYVAVVGAVHDEVEFEAAVLLDARPLPTEPADRLPDLVMLAPADLTLVTPDYAGTNFITAPVPALDATVEAAGVRGCRADEVAERGGRRCLRFSTVVGNAGAGPLDVLLPAGSTNFVQRVHASDGSHRDEEVGAAEWHVTHAHWHNAMANSYTVHAFEAATGTVGDALGEGKKGGVCFVDFGLMDVGLPGTAEPFYDVRGCMYPDREDSWSMGLSVGWFDMYPVWLPDQFVDLSGVEDGTYALCAEANTDGLLIESDATNNLACRAFRLAGDDVEALDAEPYYDWRESDAMGAPG